MLFQIVIVNWNSGHHLSGSVDSILKNHHGLVSTVVIVDNASSDGSILPASRTQTTAFGLRVILNSKNVGFGIACNQGAKMATADYLIFLNPDAALHCDTLPKVVAYLDDPANAKIGICGVQLLDENGRISRHCSRFPTATGLVAHAFGLDRIFPRLGHFMAEWDHTNTRIVDQVIGAFFVVRRSLFEHLHGFDERFFVYFEEVDFSYRARQAGWSSAYLASAQAFHAGNGTSNQIKARRLFYSLRSRLLYVFKHFSTVGAVAVLLSTLVIEPLSRSVLALRQCSWHALRETWAAYDMLWRWLVRWHPHRAGR